MAQPDLIAPPPIRVAAPKAKMTIYFALLIISLVALLLACLFMYLEIRRFDGFGAVKGKVSTVDRPAEMLLARSLGARLGRSAELAAGLDPSHTAV